MFVCILRREGVCICIHKKERGVYVFECILWREEGIYLCILRRDGVCICVYTKEGGVCICVY